jgi:hypothetical protein
MGAVALLIPRRQLLKEWAYAGAFFTCTGPIRIGRQREQTGNRRAQERRPAWQSPRVPAFAVASAC